MIVIKLKLLKIENEKKLKKTLLTFTVGE